MTQFLLGSPEITVELIVKDDQAGKLFHRNMKYQILPASSVCSHGSPKRAHTVGKN